VSEPTDGRSGRFVGKVALVTGAGRGMGRAVALLLAREGASVAVNSLNPAHAQAVAEEARSYGAAAIDVAGDVSKSEDVSRVVGDTISEFGRIDILVNNAGISRTTSPLETISDDDWYEVMDINLKGVFNFMRAVLPYMKSQKSGKIVNVSSSAGRSLSTHAGAHYTASKAGVLGLTRHAAREVAAFNINVNAVTPGTIDTPMMRDHFLREYGDRAEEYIAQEARQIPLGRVGTAEDEANLVAFLVSEEASFITGATIDINGGELMI
jgi:3-oxoacyl-[acyl-carrier protein] reductase